MSAPSSLSAAAMAARAAAGAGGDGGGLEGTATGGLACSSTCRRRCRRAHGAAAGSGQPGASVRPLGQESSRRRRNSNTPSRARTSSRTIIQRQCCESVGVSTGCATEGAARLAPGQLLLQFGDLAIALLQLFLQGLQLALQIVHPLAQFLRCRASASASASAWRCASTRAAGAFSTTAASAGGRTSTASLHGAGRASLRLVAGRQAQARAGLSRCRSALTKACGLSWYRASMSCARSALPAPRRRPLMAQRLSLGRVR